MQQQMSMQGFGGEFIIQPANIMDSYYHQQQDISPGSAGIPSPTDSCSMYPMGLAMPLQQSAGFANMQAMGMSPMFTPHRLPMPGQYHHHHLQQRDLLRCRRKVDLAKLGYKSHPTAVARRNERERNRVKHINGTFSTLRQHLPNGSKNKKMSKVETLRSAIKYINHLQQILDAQDEEDNKSDSESTVQIPHSTTNVDTNCLASESPILDINTTMSLPGVVIKSERDGASESFNSSANSHITNTPETTSSSSASSSNSTYSSPDCCSPDSSLQPCRRPRCASSSSQQCVSPVSPSCSTKSVESTIHSGYSSDDAGYDTFAQAEDELADLVDWLK